MKVTNEKENVLFKIHENYNYLNKMMVEEMEIASEHDGLTGNYREEMWVKFFRSIIPKKYSLAQGVMIIDSYGNISNEVDIVVFDEQYTPYVFKYNTLKFIPIEAVAIVVECKSTGLPEEKLKNWSKRIDKLKTKNSGIARMVTGYVSGLTNQTQIKTRPIKILTCIKSNKSEQPLENLKNSLGDDFDFIIQERQGMRTTFQVLIKNENKTLAWWGKTLNGVGIEEKLKLEHLSGIKQINKEILIGKSESEQELLEKEWVKQENDRLKKKKECLAEEYTELKFDNQCYLTNTLSKLKVKDNPFLSLNLQLNQLLMLINNPMLFPHFAYAQRFNEIIDHLEEQEQQKCGCE